jgi:hypothetical protein
VLLVVAIVPRYVGLMWADRRLEQRRETRNSIGFFTAARAAPRRAVGRLGRVVDGRPSPPRIAPLGRSNRLGVSAVVREGDDADAAERDRSHSGTRAERRATPGARTATRSFGV